MSESNIIYTVTVKNVACYVLQSPDPNMNAVSSGFFQTLLAFFDFSLLRISKLTLPIVSLSEIKHFLVLWNWENKI